MSEPLLAVDDLKTYLFAEMGVIKAVDDISFTMNSGESLGLAGESGSGKTITALSIMRLLPPIGKVVSGTITVRDLGNVLDKTEEEMMKIRGSTIAMSFQDPMTYLNPVMNVGKQIAEAIMQHQNVSKAEAFQKSVQLMSRVRIPSPELRAMDYPHQMSGGMKQRILLAIGLSCDPKILIADEPTTALDVIVQSDIIDLMIDLKRQTGVSVILISHDLGIIARMCDKLLILYAGQAMEIGPTKTIFAETMHPYTEALLESVPRLDWNGRRLKMIKGSIPTLISPPSGCRFHPRCSHATETCRKEIPKMENIGKAHLTACHHWRKLLSDKA